MSEVTVDLIIESAQPIGDLDGEAVAADDAESLPCQGDCY